MSASEIATSAWPSNSELRLEATRELPAHRRVCPFEGFRRGPDSLHKKLAVPSDGRDYSVLTAWPASTAELPNWMSTTRRHVLGGPIMFALRGRRTTGPGQRSSNGFVGGSVKETCDECA